MATDEQDTWTVEQIRDGAARVTTPGARGYVVESSPGSLRVEVYDGDELVEVNQVIRGVHEVTVLASGPRGSFLAAMAFGEDAVVTRLVLDGEETKVESDVDDHGRRLHEVLGGRDTPGSEQAHVLVERLREDPAFRADLKAATAYDVRVLPSQTIENTVNAACAVACFLCGLGQFEFCVACAICIEMV